MQQGGRGEKPAQGRKGEHGEKAEQRREGPGRGGGKLEQGGKGSRGRRQSRGREGPGRRRGKPEQGRKKNLPRERHAAVTWDVSQHPVNQVVGCWQQCWGLCYALRSMWMACPDQDGSQRAGTMGMGVARRPEGARRRPGDGLGKARIDNRSHGRQKYEGHKADRGAGYLCQRHLHFTQACYPTTDGTVQFCLFCCQPEPVPASLSARSLQLTPQGPCRVPSWSGQAIHMERSA